MSQLPQAWHWLHHCLDQHKAQELRCWPQHHAGRVCDWMVLATAQSSRHNSALVHELVLAARARGLKVQFDAQAQQQWLVVDLGQVVVHLMQQQARDYYDLDALWGGGWAGDEKPA